MNKLIDSLKMIERAYQDYLKNSKPEAETTTSDNVVSLLPKLELKKTQNQSCDTNEEASN